MRRSLLDNDLYKFTMMHAAWKLYRDSLATYRFINRRPTDRFNEAFEAELREQITALGSLRLRREEEDWLRKKEIFPDSFLEILATFQLKPHQVHFKLRDGIPDIEITGPWFETILWEVPLMAQISETYYRTVDTDWDHNLDDFRDRTKEKGLRLLAAGCGFSDFGTRRRRSLAAHIGVLEAFTSIEGACDRGRFLGTSNVHLARIFDTEPIGTMAHEWIMAHAGMGGVAGANARALAAWRAVYGDRFLIALTDTYTTDLFLKEFSPDMARTFQGLRHDSGQPTEFVDRCIAFYRSLGIDPAEKKVVFSDGLDVDRAIAVQRYVDDKMQAFFGIGTHFTNDFRSSPALNMVIKLHAINRRPVAKISDVEEKACGGPQAISEALKEIRQALHAAGDDYPQNKRSVPDVN